MLRATFIYFFKIASKLPVLLDLWVFTRFINIFNHTYIKNGTYYKIKYF